MAIYLSPSNAAPDEDQASDLRDRDIANLFEERAIPLDSRTLRALLRLVCGLAVDLGWRRFAKSGASPRRTAARRLLHSTRWML